MSIKSLGRFCSGPEVGQFLGLGAQEQHQPPCHGFARLALAPPPFGHGTHRCAAGTGADHHQMRRGWLGRKLVPKRTSHLNRVAHLQVTQVVGGHATHGIAVVIHQHPLDRGEPGCCNRAARRCARWPPNTGAHGGHDLWASSPGGKMPMDCPPAPERACCRNPARSGGCRTAPNRSHTDVAAHGGGDVTLACAALGPYRIGVGCAADHGGTRDERATLPQVAGGRAGAGPDRGRVRDRLTSSQRWQPALGRPGAGNVP